MHRTFLTLNLFNLVFVLTAVVLGYMHHPQHMLVGLLADLSAIFAFSLAMALFMGVAKLVKQHVGRYDLDTSVIERLNSVYHPLLAAVLIVTSGLVVVGLLGAVLATGWVTPSIHGAVAVAAVCLQIWGTHRVYGLQSRLHVLVDEVSQQVPVSPVPGSPAAGEAKPGFVPDELDWQRQGTKGRAFLGAGASLPLVGAYIHIVMLPLGLVWIPLGLFSALLIGVGALRLATLHDGAATPSVEPQTTGP